MPLHPIQATCEVCPETTHLSFEGLLPPGWIQVEATEAVLVEREAESPEFPALPQGTSEEVGQYIGTLQQMIVALGGELAERGPSILRRKGVGIYCPKHAPMLQARLDFPEKEEWHEDEDDGGEG